MHPFGISDDALIIHAPDETSGYWDLQTFFNESISSTDGYNPDARFPNSSACKPGTRGTIDEDSHFLRQNWLPYLDHFWTPWDPAGGSRNAIEYAKPIFDEAVLHFAYGQEDEAFFDFGRCAHILQDMGSVPHLFSDWHPDVAWLNASGFEKWCYDRRETLPTSGGSETVTSLPAAMEALGRETYRAARISGKLNRDPAHPLGEDLGMLFTNADYARYVPPDRATGIVEHWWIEGVGSYAPGRNPVDNEDNTWGPTPGLPGEDKTYFYIQYNQEHVVPASVWDGTRWVPNAGHSLAQLWAGVPGMRLTRAQEHGLIPRTIEYTAGYLRYLWDFVNPPPHLAGVRIDQDQDGDGAIDPGADEVICDRTWAAAGSPDASPKYSRILKINPGAPAMHLPVRIELSFNEMVRDVTVALGQGAPTLVVGRNLSSQRGPPTPDFPDGVPVVVLSGVDLSGLPDGTITLFVTAHDLSNHVAPVANALDPDPATRAGRLPDGSWRNIEDGGAFPDTDRNHTFELGGLQIRGAPALGHCSPGQILTHTVQVRNLSLPAETRVRLGTAGGAPGWTSDAEALNGSFFPLAAPSPAWVPTGATLTVSCSPKAAPRFEMFFTAVAEGAEGETGFTSVLDTSAAAPISDHPDDTQSVTNRRYPTPWPVDTAAPVGILLNGWGAGIGHLLGRYGIATAPVSPDLRVLNGSGADIGALEVLVIGSGGLTGLDRLPAFRERLARFVDAGGVLVVFTPQRGDELAALPGGQVAGFGWSEDQACFGAAARIAGRDPALAGQTAAVLDAGADGYLTRWPDDAVVLLERTSNGQPAMVRYPYGAGSVFVLTLYPDWGYGAGQSSPAERALVRDLVTAALAWPQPIPEHVAGDAVAAGVPVVNRAWAATATVSLEPHTPDREPLAPAVTDLPLLPGEFAAVPLTLT
ncbi:MAG TPA: hypothetical protein VN317_10120, partial [Candidatus Methanoperedens sp.]|nr:hypothetical protein [Candidatus Methanoperedens sp.]